VSSILAAPTLPRPPRAFDGGLPHPALTPLYRYADHVDAPFVGTPAKKQRPAPDRFETTDAMARWITSNPDARPFYQHPAFIDEFGHISRREAVAVVDELWACAERAAELAGISITLPARLGGNL